MTTTTDNPSIRSILKWDAPDKKDPVLVQDVLRKILRNIKESERISEENQTLLDSIKDQLPYSEGKVIIPINHFGEVGILTVDWFGNTPSLGYQKNEYVDLMNGVVEPPIPPETAPDATP